MRKKILISGPILSRSGYGEMARFAYSSLKNREDVELFVNSINWGATGNILPSEESEEIQTNIKKTQIYLAENSNNLDFDISIQITIPNEWKKIAKYNVGYTAGIETNLVSPSWYHPSQQMDKIIVISQHSKDSFINAIFGDQQGNQYKITTPVEVCHFPVRGGKNTTLDLELKNDFNFLAMCQWGPRKNLEQTIVNFIEEFKEEDVGLVLKVNIVTDSLLDKEVVENKLNELLSKFPDRKCTISLVFGNMSEGELAGLYLHPKIKAIVSTSHGEGFGFPLFEAACNELPVIATDWSGHLDFLTLKDEDGVEKKMFAKINYELKPIEKQDAWPGVLEEGSSWAYPTDTSVRSKMREVYKDYPRFKSWAKKLNAWLNQEFSEDKVSNKFYNLVYEKSTFDVENWLQEMKIEDVKEYE